MNADVVIFESKSVIQSGSFGFLHVPVDGRSSPQQGAVIFPRTDSAGVIDNPRFTVIEAKSSHSEAGLNFRAPREWSNSLERTYDDLFAKYASKTATDEEIEELVWLRKERRSTRPVRTGLELIDEIMRYEAIQKLTEAFEEYVKVVRPSSNQE